MLLSEAILEGCKVTKPFYGEFVDNTNNPTCACAFGAALIGAGVDITNPHMSLDAMLDKTFGSPYSKKGYINPDTGDPSNIGDIVVHLNDDATWGREEIAAWLQRNGL